ncbi:MAG TPA: nucleotidyltransferase family protein [Anaerolineae bacterium]|nr:nucleotidyltransferase family protein [Anaerolineae bacterium]
MVDRPLQPTSAMILAAGAGTRLRPLTERVPKCMVPVRGKPLLEHTIEWLAQSGVTRIVINVCYLPQVVTDHFGDGSRWGVSITYSPEAEPMGTAGGVKRAAHFFDGPFFVWYGDNLSRCRLDRLYAFHHARGSAATIALHYRDDPCQSGIVGLDGQDRIVRFLEKPAPEEVFSHWINAGIYVLEPRVLDAIPAGTACDFGRDILPVLLAGGVPLCGYKLSASEGLSWIDTPEDLRRMEAMT